MGTRVPASILAFLLLAAAASTAVAQERFTPWHVAKLRMATAAAVSPDGAHIAYVLSVPRTPLAEPDGAAWNELHVVQVASNTRTPYVTGHVSVSQPQWTADGRGISFLAKRDGDDARSLYVIPLGGGEARRVLAFETDIASYDWRPDGRSVAFLATPRKSKALEEIQKKGFTQEIFEETTPEVGVYLADVGEHATAGTPRRLELTGSASRALWSPDGKRLAVVLAPTPLVDDDLMQRRVHVVDPGNGKVLASLANPGKLDRVAWSPDGTAIAIVSGEDLHDPAAGRLLLKPVEGGAWTDLLPAYEGHVRDFAWRDRDTLVFIGDEGVETLLGTVRRDGTDRRTLLPAGGPVLSGIDVPRTGATLALLADTPAHPQEVYAFGSPAAGLTRLTESNPWLADVRFAPQEVVKFQARDGLALEGVLIRPLDAKPGTRYPLILTVHGGPEAHDRNGWRTTYSSPGQVAAAQGFAVFYPNYRGSTGRGVAFSKLSQGDPAGREFDDLVDAAKHLAAIGLVDEKKVGITGGSYGGYATAWASTKLTEHFAAGVMFVGISNKISKVGTTDIANEEFLVHARKRPWDDWTFFLQRSPIYYAEQSRTPLLILHGKEDPRVHPTQSLELYRYLKLHGKAPVRLVWYPGEGHGNRRAASRLDYNLRMLRWFEHYLKGTGGEPPDHEVDYRPPTAREEGGAARRNAP